MSWASWLLALIGPLVVKGLAAVGFTAVVFTGVELLVSQLITSAQTQWATMPFAVLQLATLSGVPESLGLIFGALFSLFTMRAAVGASRYIFKP